MREWVVISGEQKETFFAPNITLAIVVVANVFPYLYYGANIVELDETYRTTGQMGRMTDFACLAVLDYFLAYDEPLPVPYGPHQAIERGDSSEKVA